jgi:hypothetical protein
MFTKFIALSIICCGLAVADTTDSDLIKSIDNIDSEKSLYLFGGLSVERINDGAPRSFGAVPATDFVDRANQYLETHELSMALPKEGKTQPWGTDILK